MVLVNQVSIIDFNCGKYDLNLVKEYFIRTLADMSNVSDTKKIIHTCFCPLPGLTLLVPSLLVPTPDTKGGQPDPLAIIKTLGPMSMKFCSILEASLKVLEV